MQTGHDQIQERPPRSSRYGAGSIDAAAGNFVDPVGDSAVDPAAEPASDATVVVGGRRRRLEETQDPDVISEQTAYTYYQHRSRRDSRWHGWRSARGVWPARPRTSDDFKDAWFIGYTPTAVRGMGRIADDSIPWVRRRPGARRPRPFSWTSAGRGGRSVGLDFRVPVGIVFAQVDRQTGLIAAEGSENTQFECFKEQSLPARQESAPEDLMLKEVF